MNIRRGLMMGMVSGSLPSGWNVKQVKAQTSYTNPYDVKRWIWDQISEATLFLAIDETKQALGLNNTKDYVMIALQVIRSNNAATNTDIGGYLRYANGAYNANNNLSLDYSLFVDAGDDITIYYK